MKLAAAFLGAALLLGAAEAAGETAAPSPPQFVRSKDGGLTVSVPRGAVKKNVKVRIRVLKRGQYPPELRDATFRPGSKLYALEPAGLKFLKPVTITRRIDTGLSGFDPKDGMPIIVLTTRSKSGKWEILGGHSSRQIGKTLVIQARTRHFSTVVAFDGSYRLTLTPAAVERAVGQTFTAKVDLEATAPGQPTSDLSTDHEWEASGPLESTSASDFPFASFRCVRAGTGQYMVTVVHEDISLLVAAITLGTRGYRYTSQLTGTARCSTAPPSPQLQLAFACVVVAHTPFGSDPSFMRWLLQLAGQLPAGAQASLTVSGVNGGQAMSAPVNASTGKVELQGGINSFGAKQVQNLTVGGQNLTQQLVGKVGAAPNVTSAEGTIAGQCPP